jgi:hypothetical protein
MKFLFLECCACAYACTLYSKQQPNHVPNAISMMATTQDKANLSYGLPKHQVTTKEAKLLAFLTFE